MSGKIYKINKNGTFNSKSKYIPTYHEKEKELSENKLPHKPNSSYLEILKTPLNLKSSDYDQIYLQFKALEKGLRIELDNISEKNALIKSNELSELLALFIETGENLFLKNLKLTGEKQIDRRMWVVFKQDIEKRMKIEILKDFQELFESKIAFINKMLKNLNEMVPELNNTELSVGNQERRLMSSLFVFLGELHEFRDKLENKGKMKISDKAIANYFRAINLYPYEGKYHMLLASCSVANNDNLSAIYWSIRALMAEIPFDTKENLQEFFEKAKKNYESVMKDKTDYSEIIAKNMKDGLRLFLMAFLRYLYIFFTKISFEKIGDVSANMMDFLGKYISYLKNDNNIDKAKESSVLNYIIQMIIFSLYYTIEGFTLEEKNPEKKLQKTVEQMESNVIYAESLKFSFCMLYQIYSLLLNDECEAYLNLFLPSLFYFSTFRNIPRFLFSKFPKFKQLLCKIANRLKLKLTNLNKALQTENEETKSDEPEDSEKFNKLLEIYLLNIDKSLMGFLPLKKYYLETKKEYKIYTKENQYQLKLHLALQLLEKIDCFEGNPEDNIGEALTIMEFEMPLMEDFKNLDLSHLTSDDFKDKSKTLIVVDGQNVALRYKEDQFSSKALKMVAEYWMKKGYPIHIFLPDICYSKETVNKKKEFAKHTQSKNSTKNLPDDIEILLDLKKRGFASGIPNWTYDDSFIIDYAKTKNAYILTNDRYRDHIENYSKNDPKIKEELRIWIREHCIK